MDALMDESQEQDKENPSADPAFRSTSAEWSSILSADSIGGGGGDGSGHHLQGMKRRILHCYLGPEAVRRTSSENSNVLVHNASSAPPEDGLKCVNGFCDDTTSASNNKSETALICEQCRMFFQSQVQSFMTEGGGGTEEQEQEEPHSSASPPPPPPPSSPSDSALPSSGSLSWDQSLRDQQQQQHLFRELYLASQAFHEQARAECGDVWWWWSSWLDSTSWAAPFRQATFLRHLVNFAQCLGTFRALEPANQVAAVRRLVAEAATLRAAAQYDLSVDGFPYRCTRCFTLLVRRGDLGPCMATKTIVATTVLPLGGSLPFSGPKSLAVYRGFLFRLQQQLEGDRCLYNLVLAVALFTQFDTQLQHDAREDISTSSASTVSDRPHQAFTVHCGLLYRYLLERKCSGDRTRASAKYGHLMNSMEQMRQVGPVREAIAQSLSTLDPGLVEQVLAQLLHTRV